MGAVSPRPLYLKSRNMMVKSLLAVAFIFTRVQSAPSTTDEDIRTGIIFNQLAIAELIKQQKNVEDVRNQIASMSSSIISSQSFLLGMLEKVSNSIETTTGSITTHLEDSRNLMESLAAIVLMTQEHQRNLTLEMRRAVQENSKKSEEQMASFINILLEMNTKLNFLEASVRSPTIPSIYNHSKEVETPVEVMNKSESSCPLDFFNMGTKCFRVVKKSMTWEEARRECQRLKDQIALKKEDQDIEIITQLPSRRWKRGSHLRYDTDLAEPEDFSRLTEKLEMDGVAGETFWVGGRKHGSTWTWLSQSEIPSSLWIRGYPRSRDQVVLMRRKYPYLSTRNGRQRNPAVCELIETRTP